MSRKQKILLAVGERSLENFLKTQLTDEFIFVKEASYREIVIKRIEEEHPDIVLLREALKGSMLIENLVLGIRESFPEIRIVFYTSKSRPGEPLLRKLVSYGVYDFIAGETVSKSQIFEGLRNQKQLSDVRQYLEAPTLKEDEPAMKVTTEYKNLEENQAEPEFEVIKGPEKEIEKNKKKKEGLFNRLFGSRKKKEEKSKKKSNKKKDKTNQSEIEEAPEEETDFWDEVDDYMNEEETVVENQNKLVLSKNTATESEEDLTLGKTSNPLPMFNVPITEIKPEPVPISKGELKQNIVVVDESDSVEEDLFGSSDQNPVQKRPITEEQDDRLTLPVRGKPSSDDISLHQKELTESGQRRSIKRVEKYVEPEPEIDFNPMELDESERPEHSNQPETSSKLPPIEKPNIKQPIEHNDERSIGWFGRKNSGRIHVKNKQVVTFVSAVHGSGNTHVAFNSALKLADEGNKVLYIDLNPTFSSIDFSFQLGTWQQGVDKALEDIEYNNGMEVSNNILRIDNLRRNRKEKQFRELYKPLPDTLDYMFYSQDYQTLEEQHEVPKERLKDLVMYLTTREDYDVLIIDSEPLGEVGVDGLLNISNKIYITMTQDPGQMGVFHRQFDAAKNRVNITNDRYIIVNQFVNTEPSVKRVQKWTNETVLQTVPFTHKGVIQANYLGEPFILKTRHQPAINAFESLSEHIAE